MTTATEPTNPRGFTVTCCLCREAQISENPFRISQILKEANWAAGSLCNKTACISLYVCPACIEKRLAEETAP